MSSNKKHFSPGWVLGISLGLAGSMGVVNASEITQSYSTTTPVDVTLMTNVKTAVNDNNTRVTNMETGTGACVTNNTSDVMVRVGPICVDRHKVNLWSNRTATATATTTSGCNLDGTGAGCAGIVAQSRSSGAAADGDAISWAQAQRACTNAGKRLLTPGEWMAAYSSGLTADIATADKQEYVDAAALAYGAASTGIMEVGYMGFITGTGVNLNSNGFPYNIFASLPNIFGFRCAR